MVVIFGVVALIVVWVIVVFVVVGLVVVGEVWSLLVLVIAIVVVVEDRSKIDPGFQLACPSELKVILKEIATISVWVCVCLFVAPV